MYGKDERQYRCHFQYCFKLGRDELIKAIKQIANQVKNDEIQIDDITEEMVSDRLYTKGEPEPDLLIRTSGEQRLSNFLPWQLVYTEFLFIDKNWPEFEESDLDDAIIEYQKRTRKFRSKLERKKIWI